MNKDSEQKIIEQAIKFLENGGVILYPADTIWGIGCDATNIEAVKRVYEIKGRHFNKPLILLVSSIAQIYEVVESVHPRVDTLLTLHERPLTIIYPKAREAYTHLAAENGSLGVRVVKNCFSSNLIEAYGKPLVSTSANISAAASPTDFGSVSSEIISQVDFTVPAFTEKGMKGTASVIARYDENGDLEFLRTV